MGFPVTINGNTYQASDFSPYGYVTAFPNILSDLATVAAGIASAASGIAPTTLAIGSGGAEATPSVFRTGDTNTGWWFPAADTQAWSVGGAGKLQLAGSAFTPFASDGTALGTTTLMWSDLFLASGGVINFNDGDATVIHSANLLTVGGCDVVVSNTTASTSTTTGAVRVGGGLGVVGAIYAGNIYIGATAYGLLGIVSGSGDATVSLQGNGASRFWLSALSAANGNALKFGAGGNGPDYGVLINSGGDFAPISDNVSANGASSNRWTVVWAVNGTIQTSDETVKDRFSPIRDALGLAMALDVSEFDKYGTPDKRGRPLRQIGVRAQQLRALRPDLDLVHGGDDQILGINQADLGVIALAGLQEHVRVTQRRLAALESLMH